MAGLAEIFPPGKIFGATVLIFLTVGTWRNGYDRLVRAVDELVSAGVITEEVIAQTGYSSYKPKNMKVMEFCSPAEFRDLISRAKLVISHAGMGTIIETAQQRKPLIVVPRRSSLGEVDNDHQFSTAKQLETEGRVLVAYEVSDLPAKLEQAKTFAPTPEQCTKEILQVVQEFIDKTAAEKRLHKAMKSKGLTIRFWPYRILKRDDDGIKTDLNTIMQHFSDAGSCFDTVVFIPNAGHYLSKLFVEMFGSSFDINFITIRRASTVSGTSFVKEFIFKRKWLSNIMRHFEVLLRLVKYKLGVTQKMIADFEVDFDVVNKRVLIIDDSLDTGTTLRMAKSALLDKGAQSVTTACISNHLLPDKVDVDYSVYRYKLLRTKNSRDYYAV